MSTYWRFYWPLALTGIGTVLSIQFQNATLARYPEAVTELAILALAYGIFGLFNACLQFTAQLSNVYARSPRANRTSWQFVIIASTTIMLPLLLIATTKFGEGAVQYIFNIDAELSQRVTAYLLIMCPLILLNAQRHYLSGLMIQAHRTGWVTICNFTYLSVVIILLLAGFNMGLPAYQVVVGSELTGVCLLISLLAYARWRHYTPPSIVAHADVTFLDLLKFFVPVSTTGVMFAVSRPVLFAFVVRTPDGIAMVAALRIAFDFSMLFQQAANQFRHFFISFGFDDLKGKKRFMFTISIGLTIVLLVVAATPISTWIWGDVMGIPEDLMMMSADALLVMCFMPSIIIYRNYFHGRLMHLRRTAGMAYGATIRVLGICALAWLFFELNWLNPATAASILIIGFLIEAVMAHRISKGLKEVAVD